MKKTVWIQAIAVAGLVMLASCANDGGGGAVVAGDDAFLMPAARNPYDIAAMMTNFTGGIVLSGTYPSARDAFNLNFEAMPFDGSINFNSARAMKDVIAGYCVQAMRSNANRPIVYGNFNRTARPITNGNLTHSEADRRALILNLYVRATGNRPSDDEMEDAMASFEEILRAVPNADSTDNTATHTGTRLAMVTMCTAVAASALAGAGF